MSIRWRALVVGSAASLGLGFLFGVLAMHPSLHSDGSSLGYRLVAVPWAYFLLLVDEAEVLLALLAAHLLGGAVAGGVSPPAASNGTVTAALCAPVGIGWLLGAVPPFAMLPFVDPFTGSVDLALSSFWIVAFLAFFLLALLAGYGGGRLGGFLRRSYGSGVPGA